MIFVNDICISFIYLMIFDGSDQTYFLKRQFEAWRKLEDKLEAHRIEFRSFFLPMDLNSVHHNRDMPAGFTLYLCVADTTFQGHGLSGQSQCWQGKVFLKKMGQF